jgi:hypothetical protein
LTDSFDSYQTLVSPVTENVRGMALHEASNNQKVLQIPHYFVIDRSAGPSDGTTVSSRVKIHSLGTVYP